MQRLEHVIALKNKRKEYEKFVIKAVRIQSIYNNQSLLN